jgi:hypothetical protein
MYHKLRRLTLLAALLLTLWLAFAGRPNRLQAQNPPGVTSTPLPRQVTEISHPKTGDAVAGFTSIIGSTLVSNCMKYQLDIAVAGSEDWQFLAAPYKCIANSEIYRLDTKKYRDGFYDLRLRAVRSDGNYVEAFLRGLEIRNSYPPTPTPAIDPFGSPLPTPTLTPFPQATPTGQAPFVYHIPGGQGFYAPEIGETVSGYVNIVGTVNAGYPGREYGRYELAISPAGQANWTYLYSSEAQIWQNVIYTLNTRGFADGSYDLRLRIVYGDGNYDDFYLRYLRIANRSRTVTGMRPPVYSTQQSGLTAPQGNTNVATIVEVKGTAIDPNFLRWELHWSPSGDEQWSFLASGEQQVVNGVFARLDLRQLAGNVIDLRLRVVRRDANYDEYWARKIRIVIQP